MKRKQKKSTQPVPSSTPEEVAARYRSLLSAEEYEKLIQEINQPLPPAIRINPLKTSPGFPLGFHPNMVGSWNRCPSAGPGSGYSTPLLQILAPPSSIAWACITSRKLPPCSLSNYSRCQLVKTS